MDEYPSNSNRANDPTQRIKKEPKKVDRIITSEVVRKKPSLGKRLMQTFIGGDTQSTWSYVLFDVMVPAAKDMMSDAVSQGVERMLFGESVRSPSRRARASGPNGYVSYNRFSPSSGGRQREAPREMSRRSRAVHNFDEIILETRAEAEEVISRLFDLLARYDSATVADLYELLGVTADFPDEKYGWTDIRGAGATRVRNGYLLDLPKPELLE